MEVELFESAFQDLFLEINLASGKLGHTYSVSRPRLSCFRSRLLDINPSTE